MCSDTLKTGARIKLRVDGGQREVFGEVTQVDSGGLGLRVRDDPENAPSYFDREQIVSIHAQRRRFPRPVSSLKGLGIGTLVGTGAALVAGYPRESSGQELPDLFGAFLVLAGASAGLIVGTAVPIIHPGEKEIECAW